MSYKIEWYANDVVITYTGNLTAKEIIKSLNTLIADARFDKINYQIADFRGIDCFKFEEDEIEIIAALDNSSSQWNRRMRIANVATDINLIKKIEEYNMYMKLSNWQTRFFDNMDDALKWCKE